MLPLVLSQRVSLYFVLQYIKQPATHSVYASGWLIHTMKKYAKVDDHTIQNCAEVAVASMDDAFDGDLVFMFSAMARSNVYHPILKVKSLRRPFHAFLDGRLEIECE